METANSGAGFPSRARAPPAGPRTESSITSVAEKRAIDASADPVLATHHGLRSFNDIPRTMPDGLLRKLAAKGGVIGFQIGNGR